MTKVIFLFTFLITGASFAQHSSMHGYRDLLELTIKSKELAMKEYQREIEPLLPTIVREKRERLYDCRQTGSSKHTFQLPFVVPRIKTYMACYIDNIEPAIIKVVHSYDRNKEGKLHFNFVKVKIPKFYLKD